MNLSEIRNALQLADDLDNEFVDGRISNQTGRRAATELRRLHHNNEVLMNALWKACGDDEDVVNATIESQGDLK